MLAGGIGVVWTAGDASAVTTGVVETGEGSAIVTVALDSVGSADASGMLFPLQEVEKMVKSTIIVLRIKRKGLNFGLLISQKVVVCIVWPFRC